MVETAKSRQKAAPGGLSCRVVQEIDVAKSIFSEWVTTGSRINVVLRMRRHYHHKSCGKRCRIRCIFTEKRARWIQT